jgi:hypothetical protein
MGRFRSTAIPSPRAMQIAGNAARRQVASDAAAIAEEVASAVAAIDTRLDEIDGRVGELENPIP